MMNNINFVESRPRAESALALRSAGSASLAVTLPSFRLRPASTVRLKPLNAEL